MLGILGTCTSLGSGVLRSPILFPDRAPWGGGLCLICRARSWEASAGPVCSTKHSSNSIASSSLSSSHTCTQTSLLSTHLRLFAPFASNSNSNFLFPCSVPSPIAVITHWPNVSCTTRTPTFNVGDDELPAAAPLSPSSVVLSLVVSSVSSIALPSSFSSFSSCSSSDSCTPSRVSGPTTASSSRICSSSSSSSSELRRDDDRSRFEARRGMALVLAGSVLCL
mmetsp:Transcript_61952/g.85430  ORF Transcript_61952/g.85430 Transcript_61952/m.85430 type:complete len:223 (+) Transcript_61952:75-743(+)